MFVENPQLTQLQQILALIPRKQQNNDQNQNQNIPQLYAQPQSSGGTDMAKSALGMLGGLMGGSGDGINSFTQGFGFQSVPSGSYGPFNGQSSALSFLSRLGL